MSAIQRHMLMMFIALRIGVGVVGISLPVILAGVGYLAFKIPLAGSLSAYYHATKECSGLKAADTLLKVEVDPVAPVPDPCEPVGIGPMRNWFVGNLFFIGGAMFLMRGFSRLENWMLNVAGIMAPGVALFPMNWGKETGFNPHLTFAVIFFLCIGFTAVFCSEKTLNEMPAGIPDRARVIAFYRRWYQVLGTLMVVAPLCAHLFLRRDPHRMFAVETAGVWAFGAYWLFKTRELKRSDIEGRAFRGQLTTMDPHSWR